MSRVSHLNPYQLHAFARRWESMVLWDYHPSDHGISLATDVVRGAGGLYEEPDDSEIFEAMLALEAAGVECPVYGSTWAGQSVRWGLWLGVVSGPVRSTRNRLEPSYHYEDWTERTSPGAVDSSS